MGVGTDTQKKDSAPPQARLRVNLASFAVSMPTVRLLYAPMVSRRSRVTAQAQRVKGALLVSCQQSLEASWEAP